MDLIFGPEGAADRAAASRRIAAAERPPAEKPAEEEAEKPKGLAAKLPCLKGRGAKALAEAPPEPEEDVLVVLRKAAAKTVKAWTELQLKRVKASRKEPAAAQTLHPSARADPEPASPSRSFARLSA